MEQNEKIKDVLQLKQIINQFIEKYYNCDIVKIEVHKNKNMGKNISINISPMNPVERF